MCERKVTVDGMKVDCRTLVSTGREGETIDRQVKPLEEVGRVTAESGDDMNAGVLENIGILEFEKRIDTMNLLGLDLVGNES